MPDFVPYYRRIMADITAQIDAGALPPGSQLPSTRDLAEQYGVGTGTVRAAIVRLLETGVLTGHQGRGVYVAD